MGEFNLLDVFVNLAVGLLNVLPESPFLLISSLPVSEFISGIAWFVPIPEILAILQAWTAAILIFYGYKIILRWVKLL